MEVFRPRLVSASAMTRFHSDDYINFLKVITPDNMQDYIRQMQVNIYVNIILLYISKKNDCISLFLFFFLLVSPF